VTNIIVSMDVGSKATIFSLYRNCPSCGHDITLASDHNIHAVADAVTFSDQILLMDFISSAA